MSSLLQDLQSTYHIVESTVTRARYYAWKTSQQDGLITYDQSLSNVIFDPPPAISDDYEAVEYSQCVTTELNASYRRLYGSNYVPTVPVVMTGAELYRAFTASQIGLTETDSGYISLACLCNADVAENKSDPSRYLECVGLQLDHRNTTVTSITMKGGLVVGELGSEQSKYARMYAQIGYCHSMTMHQHNYVHFHLLSAFAVAVNEGTAERRRSLTNTFLNPHTKFTLVVNQAGLSGGVTDGFQTSVFTAPITGMSVDETVFNANVVDSTSRFFGRSPHLGTNATHIHNRTGKYSAQRRLVFGYPFTYDGRSLDHINPTDRSKPFYIRTLCKYYRAYYRYFSVLRRHLHQKELDAIQLRTADLMGNLGGSIVRTATSDHFFATALFIAGALHSTDHLLLNGVIVKHSSPVYGTQPDAGAELQPWDHKSLVISENFRRLAIANVAASFHESINHRQDLMLPIDALTGHAAALTQLNESLDSTMKEICDYVGVAYFYIYPSVCF